MPQFFVLAGRDLGKRFDLAHADTLGRGADCGGVLRDPSVSRAHARVEASGGRWFLVDLDSRNGLRVGGERVARVELSDELEVTLGKLPLRVRLDAAPAPHEAEAEPGAATEVEDSGFELEEDIDLGARTETFAPDGKSRASAPPLSERDQKRAQLLESATMRAGLFSSELSQYPTWARVGIYLLVAVAAGGLCFATFRVVEFLRRT